MEYPKTQNLVSATLTLTISNILSVIDDQHKSLILCQEPRFK